MSRQGRRGKEEEEEEEEEGGGMELGMCDKGAGDNIIDTGMFGAAGTRDGDVRRVSLLVSPTQRVGRQVLVPTKLSGARRRDRCGGGWGSRGQDEGRGRRTHQSASEELD